MLHLDSFKAGSNSHHRRDDCLWHGREQAGCPCPCLLREVEGYDFSGLHLPPFLCLGSHAALVDVVWWVQFLALVVIESRTELRTNGNVLQASVRLGLHWQDCSE